MSRVCLINPILFSTQTLRTRSFYANESMSYFPPLSLAYIAGSLEKNGIDVLIVDRNVLMRRYSSDLKAVDHECKRRIQSFAPDYAGITCTTPTFVDVRKNIIPLIKETGSDITIIVGGPHATAMHEYILNTYENIDMVCRGEGELTMLELASDKPLSQIKGLVYRNESQIVLNEERPAHKNIDDFCPPARHLLEMDSYCRPNPYIMHGLYMSATTIFTSRGCPFDCTFCAGKVALGRRVRFQSNDLVIQEIESLINGYGIEGLYFADDMFEARQSRVKQICAMMIDQGIHKKLKWIAQVRANTVNEDILKLMKEAGCVRLEFGFETGSQKVLDILNKKTTVQQNYHAAHVAQKVGLPFQANIIVGMPGEDIDDLGHTKKFMTDIKPHWIGFGEFTPLPGSRLYDDLLKEGKISIDEIEKLQGFNFTEMSNDTFENFIKDVRKSIVIPIRIKSFLSDNLRSVKGILFVCSFILKTLKNTFHSLLFSRPSASVAPTRRSP